MEVVRFTEDIEDGAAVQKFLQDVQSLIDEIKDKYELRAVHDMRWQKEDYGLGHA